MRIALQLLLNLKRQSLHAAPHVGVARRDPHPHPARHRDHRSLRTFRTRRSASASTALSTRTRLPEPSSISITPDFARRPLAITRECLAAGTQARRRSDLNGQQNRTVSPARFRNSHLPSPCEEPCRRATSRTTSYRVPATFPHGWSNMYEGAKNALSKVPEVTLGFWIIKILATTIGETGGDAVTMSLFHADKDTNNGGYLIGTCLFMALFIAAVMIQITMKRFHPFIYWVTIVATTTAGTAMADFADRSLGIGYLGGSSLLFALLMMSLLLWRWSRAASR